MRRRPATTAETIARRSAAARKAAATRAAIRHARELARIAEIDRACQSHAPEVPGQIEEVE